MFGRSLAKSNLKYALNNMLRKKITQSLVIALLIGWATGSHAQSPLPALIPIPVDAQMGKGSFALTANTAIVAPSGEVEKIAKYLAGKIAPATGVQMKIAASGNSNVIEMKLNKDADPVLGDEGYKLEVTTKKITIQANQPAGLFYGVQTLLQLLPKYIEGKTIVNTDWQIPAVSITDYPRFGWRGLMLDVSRHFFPKEVVKAFIDEMARYKYNRFHWHLTDDQGWRIEIKTLPRLTSVGAWRVPRYGKWGANEPPKPGEAATDGGFYTHEDIREIVQYAKERYIEIMPEIDVPGHSMAAIAAYPELCVTQDTTIKVNPGSKFSTWHGDGTFTMHIDNNLDPSNEKVYEFLDKVFTEVADLFPFEYIHMGGDEAFKGYWEEDPDNQALMKRLNLKDSDALQAYFNNRVTKIIQSKGKKAIGWDEILEGGLPEGAAVMSWRGVKGGVEASQQKAFTVMSPSPMAYLDLYQGDPAAEPPSYNMARFRDTYNWEPIVQGIDPAYVLGGQGNIWTERISTKAHMEYMAYPKAFALAEIYWSPQENKDWSAFVSRVEDHFERFDEAGMNYARSMYDPIIKVTKNKEDQLVIDMTTEIEGLDLYYTLDNTLPNQYYPHYKAPIVVPIGTDLFRVISYRQGKPIGKMIAISIKDLEKRVRK